MRLTTSSCNIWSCRVETGAMDAFFFFHPHYIISSRIRHNSHTCCELSIVTENDFSCSTMDVCHSVTLCFFFVTQACVGCQKVFMCSTERCHVCIPTPYTPVSHSHSVSQPLAHRHAHARTGSCPDVEHVLASSSPRSLPLLQRVC